MKLDVLVPTSLSEITLNQFVRFADSEEKNAGSTFQMQKCVEIMCNIDLQAIATIKYTDVKDIYEHILDLLKPEQDLIPTFKMDGIEYGFIPELDEISLGEYIDLDENITSWKTMHKAMAVLYRPITIKKDERYDVEEYKGLNNAEKFKQMPVDVAIGANFFLFNLGIELLETTLSYSKEEPTMTSAEKQTLLENGVGFKASLDSLKEILHESKISLN